MVSYQSLTNEQISESSLGELTVKISLLVALVKY